MNNADRSRAVLRNWYDNMWGKCDFALIPRIAAPHYLRHDITGANNLMPATAYRDMLQMGLRGEEVTAFHYFLVAEDNYVAALGHYILSADRQWDWVQLFRIENDALAETWLTGMGGTDPLGYPQPRNAWTGTEIPPQGELTPNKRLVQDWYRHLTGRYDPARAGELLADPVRVHDISSADRLLTPAQYQQALEAQLDCSEFADCRLFMIEENDMVVAVGSWTLDGERQWDWEQAFQIRDGKIARTWLPAIGGSDTSLQHGPHGRWSPQIMPAGATQVA